MNIHSIRKSGCQKGLLEEDQGKVDGFASLRRCPNEDGSIGTQRRKSTPPSLSLSQKKTSVAEVEEQKVETHREKSRMIQALEVKNGTGASSTAHQANKCSLN